MSMPEIRFPEFKEPWRPTVAGSAFKHSRARGEAGLPIYSVTLDRGMVRRDSLDRHMEGDAADGQNLRAQPGDVVYNMMRMWQGAVGVAPQECMVSPAYVVLRPTKETNPRFFSYWFQNSRMLHKLGAYSHGLTKDRLRLYPDDFAKIPLNLPCRAEQDRIAAFFEAVDAKLAALREKADGLRQFKTGLMQRLFSQEKRFTREDGSDFPDWEEKLLGKMGRFTGGGTPDTNNQDFWSGDVAWISSSDLSEGNILSLDIKRRITQEAIKSSATQVTPKGAVLIVTRVGIGKCCISPEDVCTSQDFTNFVPADGLGEFFAYWLLFNQGRLKSLAQGTSIKGITVQDLKSLKVDVPHPDEQAKIASALSALDAKIDAVTDQITHMETFKKGLLQKMFV